MLLYAMGGNVLIILSNVKPNKKIAFLVDFVFFKGKNQVKQNGC
jgi:hypothetical protein